jgi:hypothetical protein
MAMIAQSVLETAVLDRFHQLYQAKGFPPASSIGVVRRENTGGGRYEDLESDAPVQMDDGYLDLDGGLIEMDGLPNGMMAVVLVRGARVKTLELAVYGGDFWDGEERPWKIV